MTRRSPIFRNARERRRAERRAARAAAAGSPLEAADALRRSRDPRQLAFDEGFWFVDARAPRGGGEWGTAFNYLSDGEGLEAFRRHAEARTALEFMDGMASWLTYNEPGMKYARRDREKWIALRHASVEEAAQALGAEERLAVVSAAREAARAAARSLWRGRDEVVGAIVVSAAFEGTKLGTPVGVADRQNYDDAAVRVSVHVMAPEDESREGVDPRNLEAVVWLDPATLEPREPPRLLQALESPGLVFDEPRAVVRSKILSFAQDGPSPRPTLSEAGRWIDEARPWLEPEVMRAFPATHPALEAMLEDVNWNLALSTPGADLVLGNVAVLRERVQRAGTMFRADPHAWVSPPPPWPDHRQKRAGVRLRRAWDRVLAEVEKADSREVVARAWLPLEP